MSPISNFPSPRQMPSHESEGQQIVGSVRRCETLFRGLLSTLVNHNGFGTHYRTARDYFQNFELWVGYIGAYANGDASLDIRLRFYPEVRNLVMGMLELLEQNLSHGFWFDSAGKEEVAQKAPTIVSETSTSLAAVAALEAIQEAIDRLHRLAVLIRTSRPFSLTSGIGTFAGRANLVKGAEFQEMAWLFVKGRFPGISSKFAAQIVSSICFRRLRLLYEGNHNGNFGTQHLQTTSAPSNPETEMTQWEGDLSRPDVLQMEVLPARPLQKPADSKAENSEFNFNFEKFQQYKGGSTDMSDTSTTTLIGQGYSYPPRPKPGTTDQYCPCNWCSEEIKVSDLNTPGWWRAHFKKDLQPYVCISEDCWEPAVYFTSFSEWRKHMEDIHMTDWARRIHSPQVWYCDVSPHEYLEFGEEGKLEHHLKNEHSALDSKQLKMRLAFNMLSVPRGKNICPLCSQEIQIFSISNEGVSKGITDDVSNLSRHVAEHLESLAFLSIR
ncbi:hypothetical protein F4859DRAFT_481260 [Xylaria cf. heliscus]|nr:hypothetical protein F4859DRAFT_481260 [Xylaria cf. heliscus]